MLVELSDMHCKASYNGCKAVLKFLPEITENNEGLAHCLRGLRRVGKQYRHDNLIGISRILRLKALVDSILKFKVASLGISDLEIGSVIGLRLGRVIRLLQKIGRVVPSQEALTIVESLIFRCHLGPMRMTTNLVTHERSGI